jgi:hypothetical protein
MWFAWERCVLTHVKDVISVQHSQPLISALFVRSQNADVHLLLLLSRLAWPTPCDHQPIIRDQQLEVDG